MEGKKSVYASTIDLVQTVNTKTIETITTPTPLKKYVLNSNLARSLAAEVGDKSNAELKSSSSKLH